KTDFGGPSPSFVQLKHKVLVHIELLCAPAAHLRWPDKVHPHTALLDHSTLS
ncbi:hypothetical protein NEOC65_000101, partial [Neochlamydia sp. AcF65]|nr:hypothetical protein [Neochlamydia sp. AcF65]